ncbi:biotin/lipoyl-binding protein [Candidatus Woesearchaeota archaeon]|nr:biotin/lipoyl-binding protein [Candidatus Woesearchaeota archaeon]
MEDLIIKVDGKEYNVKVEETEDGKIRVHCGGDVYEVETKSNVQSEVTEEIKRRGVKENKDIIVAPLPGTIFSVDVKKGDKVKEGDKLVSLMAMKMESEIVAPKEGKVNEVKVKKNDSVNKGDILVIIE